MKLARICVIALLGCSVVALTGCAGVSGKDKGMQTPDALEPQAILKFGDIPVPSGFKMLPKDSYTFENSGTRVAVLKYQGKAEADRVVGFYKEQMPMYNWNLLNIIEYGDRLLNFERENETCIVSLSPKGNCITITISLGPKSTIAPKKSKTPVK